MALDQIGRETSVHLEPFPYATRVDRDSYSNAAVTLDFGTNDLPRAAAVQTDGRLIILGRASTPAGFQDIGLARLNRDGSPDTSFGTTGKVVTTFGNYDDWPHALVLYTDGRIAVAGRASNGSNLDFAVLRYHTNGTLDTSFGTRGAVKTMIGTSTDIARSVKIDSTNRLVVGGYRFDGTKHDNAVVRYETNGGLDTSFNTTGKLVFTVGTNGSSITAMGIHTDGKVVMTGAAFNSLWHVFVARLTTDGVMDTSFNTTGGSLITIGTNQSVAYALDFHSTGKIVLGGNYTIDTPTTGALVLRILTNGRLDTSFGTGTGFGRFLGTMGARIGGNAIVQERDNVALVGSLATSASGSSGDFFILRLFSNGTHDYNFSSSGYSISALGDGSDQAVAVTRNQSFYGEYYLVGQTQNGDNWDFGVIRYDYWGYPAPTGAVDYAFRSSGYVHVTNIAQSVRRIAGDTSNRLLSATSNSLRVFRYQTDGSLDTSFNTTGASQMTGVNSQDVFVDSTGRLYVSGRYNGAIPILARYSSNGRWDTSFANTGVFLGSAFTDSDSSYQSIAMQTDGRALVAGGTQMATIARVETNGTFDTSFATVGVIVTTYFSNFAGLNQIRADTLGRSVVIGYQGMDYYQASNYLVVRYSSNGSPDTSFATTGFKIFNLEYIANSAGAFVFDSQGRMVITGTSYTAEDDNQIYIFRLATNGDIDTAFGEGGTTRPPIMAGYYGQRYREGLVTPRNRDQYYLFSASHTVRLLSNGRLDTSFATLGIQSGVVCTHRTIQAEDGGFFCNEDTSVIRKLLP